MRFTFNVQKRHVITLLFGGLLLFGIYFAIAQTPTAPNPGHIASQINIGGTIGDNLENWANGAKTALSSLDGRVNLLEGAAAVAEQGMEVYVGRGTYSAVGWSISETPYIFPSAIKSVRIDIISTSRSTVNPTTCPEMVLDASNNFLATCDSSGLRTFLWSSSECNTPANVDWLSFDVYGLNSASWKDRIDKDGISSIKTILCDDSPDSGTVVFDLYLTPYAHKIQDRRISPYVVTQNPIIFNLLSTG